MAKYGDLLVGFAAILYTILAVVLNDMSITDLGEYICQPQLSGAFGMAACGRGWKTLKSTVAAEVAEKAKAAAAAAPEGE